MLSRWSLAVPACQSMASNVFQIVVLFRAQRKHEAASGLPINRMRLIDLCTIIFGVRDVPIRMDPLPTPDG